jgi:hypothetical protein
MFFLQFPAVSFTAKDHGIDLIVNHGGWESGAETQSFDDASEHLLVDLDQ